MVIALSKSYSTFFSISIALLTLVAFYGCKYTNYF